MLPACSQYGWVIGLLLDLSFRYLFSQKYCQSTSTKTTIPDEKVSTVFSLNWGVFKGLSDKSECFALAFRGHNGKVKSIFWSPDDSRLVSAGADGAVYEWKVKDVKREKENVLKVSSS